MDKFDDFVALTNARFDQLQDQINAQQLVMAWLLSRLEKSENFQPDLIRSFLYSQAEALADSSKFAEYVAVIDSLFEDLVHFSSLQDRTRLK